jgi:ABC-2 type transport system ATP-binding protein
MNSTDTDTTVLEIRGLAKRYGGFEAVSSLELRVSRGEIFALLGPNGAGKTTTIRMLMGILQPTRGTASIQGRDCFLERVEVKRLVGYLPDEPVFYDYLRGREIIRFVGEMHGLDRGEIERRSVPLLERFAIADAREEYAVNYSRGMKKKLALACALLHQPSFLILDEPTSGLDPHSTRELHSLLREETSAGKTVFYSTHVLDQAEKLCHRAGILYKGELAAVGTLEELRSKLAPGGSLEEIFFAVTSGGGGEDG